MVQKPDSGNMIIATKRDTQICYNAIMWTGKNKIQMQQFGKTMLQNYTRVNCRNTCKVYQDGLWKEMRVGEWVVVSERNIFIHMTHEQFEKSYYIQ